MAMMGKEIVRDLCGAFELEKQYKLLKKAQRYSVNLFPHEFDKLANIGAIHEVQEGAGVFYLDDQYYSKEFGWSDEIVNDMESSNRLRRLDGQYCGVQGHGQICPVHRPADQDRR